MIWSFSYIVSVKAYFTKCNRTYYTDREVTDRWIVEFDDTSEMQKLLEHQGEMRGRPIRYKLPAISLNPRVLSEPNKSPHRWPMSSTQSRNPNVTERALGRMDESVRKSHRPGSRTVPGVKAASTFRKSRSKRLLKTN